MWNCPSCTLKNESHIILCILCSTQRPTPTLNYYPSPTSELNSSPMTNSNAMPNTPEQSSTIKARNRKKWKKLSSASSYLQFEYNHHNNNNQRHIQNQNNNSNTNDMAYQFDFGSYVDGDLDTLINGDISHSSSKNIKQINQQFKSPKFLKNIKLFNNNNHHRKYRKKKYSITDIFASNSSFILDHQYNENDICNLILNNSTQTQTKLRFLKSIWPHILRVTTRVLNGSKFRCPICLNQDIYIGRITKCGHCFCGMCLIHHLNQNDYLNESKTDDNYNFRDLFGHCPLCNDYVSFEECRPLTVIRCIDYKVNDMIDIQLIERRKGEQPQFPLNYNYNHNLNISTFRKFETEKNEILKCDNELNEINNFIKSSDPFYEAPYLQLLSIQIKQYKTYILKQRQEYKINDNKENIRENYYEYNKYNNNQKNNFNVSPKPVLVTHNNNNNNNNNNQQQQHRYRKKKYVYQSSDGQLIFLHPHNYNMLKHQVNYNFAQLPTHLSSCKILQIDPHVQSYDLRRKYPFLAFIPVDISFCFIEVDLSFNNIVSKSTLKYFEKQSLDRKSYRVEKEKLIEKELKHKEIIEQQRIAEQKQKYTKRPIDINDYQEFPSLCNDKYDNDTHSNSDNQSDNSPCIISNSNKNIKSPAQKSWSQITVNKKALTASNSNSNKKKRRRGRNKKKNKKKEKD